MAKQSEVALTRDNLVAACRRHGLECFMASEKSLDGLLHYVSLLMKWNKVMNLVGKSQWEETLSTLIADSAVLLPFLQSLQEKGLLDKAPLIWDLGAGAGLPGIPLRLVWPHGRYFLVDSREKRTLFLKTVLASHDFGETHVAQARVEDFFLTQPPAQMIISRAFMPWEQVLDLVAPPHAAPHVVPGALAVFLTLLPAPQEYSPKHSQLSPQGSPSDDPCPRWHLVQEQVYTIHGDTRYVWAMQLQK